MEPYNKIRKFGLYEYEILENEGEWYYVIYDPYEEPDEHFILRESKDWYESQERANLAAIGHISLLEKGEG